jgi:hypothetical protein
MVNKLWKDLYERVEHRRVLSQFTTRYDPFTCVPQMTLFSSVFASASRLRLAHSSGYGCLQHRLDREYRAGWIADKATMMMAHELGLMKYTSDTLTGAVRAGDLAKAMWLHTEQLCELNCPRACDEAAMAGSIEVLKWLKQLGVDPIEDTCDAACRERLHACAAISACRRL